MPDNDPKRVVAAVLLRSGRVLLCHRHPDRSWYPNVWDLPGGHVETGERPYAALRRELREELGISVPSADRPPDRSIENDDVRMDVWYVEEFDGEPRNLCPDEHDAVGWFHPDDPAARPLAHPLYTVLLHGRPVSR